MTRALLQIFVCLSFIQSDLAGASDNYPYEPEIVELEGVLVQERRFGSPNYGETPEIDERLKIYVLSLKMPITVGTRDSLSELNDAIVSDVDKIQIDFVNDVPKTELAGKAVILQGTLSKSIWGREFYPVVLTVRNIVSITVAAEDVDLCSTVDKCIARIYEVAEPPESKYSDISDEEWSIARRISQFGDEAVVKLISLLTGDDEDIAQIASAALRDVERIDPKYLPDILTALDSDMDFGWLPPALGRIHSSEAAEEAVKRLLVSDSAPGNQEAYAVRLSGIRAVPFIVEFASCKKECGHRDHFILGTVLSEMDEPSRREAAVSLLNPIKEASSDKVQEGILRMVGMLGKPALVIESDLLALKSKKPFLEEKIDQVLIDIGSTHAVAILANWLREKPDSKGLLDLSTLGPQGKDAGPVVVELLDHPRWIIRTEAARTLGFIEYRGAVPQLLTSLTDESDVILNWVSAQSLGRIADKSALNALKQVSKSHWHPTVRRVAEKALINLETLSEYERLQNNAGLVFTSNLQTEPCEKVALQAVDALSDTKLYANADEQKLKSLSYPSEIIGLGLKDETAHDANSTGVIEFTVENTQMYHEPIIQLPDVAMKVPDGWLVGSNRGEWGGELVFIGDGEKPQLLLRDNIEDIYRLGDRYIAVAGLAHLGFNYGSIFEIILMDNGSWNIDLWRKLPGAPYSSWFVETGELLINTYGGGSILVSAEGSMRMAPCQN